jgi:hypothetical protein
MFSETREEKILDILKSISFAEREKAVIAGTLKDFQCNPFGTTYNEVEPDDYLAKTMERAIDDYKLRLHEELKTIQKGRI